MSIGEFLYHTVCDAMSKYFVLYIGMAGLLGFYVGYAVRHYCGRKDDTIIY